MKSASYRKTIFGILSRVWLLSCLYLSIIGHADGQMYGDETFGKNRVQYHDNFKNWWSYESQNFITYWPSPARKAAEASILYAELSFDEIHRILEHHINDKVKLLVFSDLTDLKQSNLGTSEIFEIKSGETKVDGDRIFIYFDGDHGHLRQQIREGIAEVYVNFMLQGNSIQQFVRSNFYNSLPNWFIPGLISFIGSNENYAIEQGIKLWFLRHDKEGFDRLSLHNSRIAGHLLWNYIYAHYGHRDLTNLLYLSRINRQIEQSFLYVLGKDLEQVKSDAYEYYRTLYQRYTVEAIQSQQNRIKVRGKKKSRNRYGGYNLKVTEVQIAPSNDEMLYVTNEIGRYTMWQYHFKSAKTKKIIKRSFKNPFQPADANYPIIRFDKTNGDCYVIEEIKDKIWLSRYNADLKKVDKQLLPPKVDRVYSMDIYGRDTLVMSANIDGYVDLILYTPRTRQTTSLTTDFFDDKDAVTVQIGGQRYIAFSSNRWDAVTSVKELDTIPPNSTFDLFLLSPTDGAMQQLTFTPHASESELESEGHQIYYLTDYNGVRNRWKLDIAADELRPQMMSNRVFNIEDFAIEKNMIVEVQDLFDDVQLTYTLKENDSPKKVDFTPLAQLIRQEDDSPNRGSDEDSEIHNIPLRKDKLSGFQSPYDEEIKVEWSGVETDDQRTIGLLLPEFSQLNSTSVQNDRIQPFNSARMLAYRLTFGLTDYELDVNNDLLFTGLNSFAGFNRGFEFPDPGLLMRVETRDLVENYIVSGGARIPLSFDGTEFYLSVSDRKKQLDRTLSFYRISQRLNQDDRFEFMPDTRNTTHMGVLELNYPFSIFSSLRLSTTLRYDKTTILPRSASELAENNTTQQRIGLKLEYIFDNSYETISNIRIGSRAKIYVEGMNRFDLQFDPIALDWSQAILGVIGIDARHYLRLDRLSIIAGRLAAATSFGSEQILYHLGGVRNWLGSKYDTSTPLPASDRFAFQAAAVDMRGFRQNVRNGATYALMNLELRIPLFNYLSKYELKSRFLRQFQVVGFVDMGTAWHGSTPFDPVNTLNRDILSNDLAVLDVQYYRDPLIIGYGGGVRLSLLGYFIRIDYAVGLETRTLLDPIWYISMGHDF